MLKQFLRTHIKILLSLFVLLFLVFSFSLAADPVLLENYEGLTNGATSSLSSTDPETAITAYINMLVKFAFGFASIGAVALII